MKIISRSNILQESQNIEFKESWKDDHLKYLAGFANTDGGTLYIGINDKGVVKGIAKDKELLENIPQKAKSILGMYINIYLKHEGNNKFLEIIIPRYDVPISYYGKYFIRSGSTLLELNGSALTEFLLRRTGKTWDDIIEPNATIKDLDEDCINKYINDTKKAKRINIENDLSIQSLLTKLRLIENKKIKRAAIVLFGKDPSKFYPNLQIKIGRFGSSDSDLRFHEVLERNLIELRNLIPEVLNAKFFKHPIDFIGLQRFESDEYPVEAIREMILNALVHRSYLGSFTQVKVFDDKFEIWNDGGLPEGITEDNLRHSHAPKPRNPIIADVFFKAGYIDTWGRGTITIIESCKLSNLPEPILIEKNGGFLVSISKNKYTREVLEQMGLNKRQLKAIEFIKTNNRITNKEYQGINDCARNTASNDLKDLVDRNLLKSSDIKGAGSFYQLF